MRRLPIFLACMASMAWFPPAAQPAVSAGRFHNPGLAADGSVFWWGAVRNIAAVSSYSSILALRADGFVCTMGSNMGGVTLPGDASPEIDRFVPLPLGNGRGLLNLADARRPAPADVCVATSP